ncbi:copper transporter 6-like [Ananas comosus]|uniref:Copper transport protein n=1 Tax=Ananas comosus TaxID=4615 RepID=A0A6P5EXT4_ANACO|nr:copper transporter 6-like [Ananas comosus]
MAMGGGSGMGDGMGMPMPMPPPPSSMSMPTPMPSDDGMGGNGKMMMMHMTFFWGKRVQVLFSDWPGDRGLGMYVASLVFVLALAALAEAFSAASGRLARPGSGPLAAALLTLLHAARMGIAYLVMLAVMSFNVGVLIAAIVGHALGFLFARSGIFAKGSGPVDAEAQPNTHPPPPSKS